jgi:hypothetical protein
MVYCVTQLPGFSFAPLLDGMESAIAFDTNP